MAEHEIKTRLIIAHQAKADLDANQTVLKEGELLYDLTTERLKAGQTDENDNLVPVQESHYIGPKSFDCIWLQSYILKEIVTNGTHYYDAVCYAFNELTARCNSNDVHIIFDNPMTDNSSELNPQYELANVAGSFVIVRFLVYLAAKGYTNGRLTIDAVSSADKPFISWGNNEDYFGLDDAKILSNNNITVNFTGQYDIGTYTGSSVERENTVFNQYFPADVRAYPVATGVTPPASVYNRYTLTVTTPHFEGKIQNWIYNRFFFQQNAANKIDAVTDHTINKWYEKEYEGANFYEEIQNGSFIGNEVFCIWNHEMFGAYPTQHCYF